MKANRKFVKGEEAVSAVIGVILMVAITVAIAATVYVYVSGMLPSGGSITPSITVSPNDQTNTLLISGADPVNAGWENVNITVTWKTGYEHYEWINLTNRNTGKVYSDGGAHAPQEWGSITAGDTLQIPTGDAVTIVTMRWIPTNKLLGSWTFQN